MISEGECSLCLQDSWALSQVQDLCLYLLPSPPSNRKQFTPTSLEHHRYITQNCENQGLQVGSHPWLEALPFFLASSNEKQPLLQSSTAWGECGDTASDESFSMCWGLNTLRDCVQSQLFLNLRQMNIHMLSSYSFPCLPSHCPSVHLLIVNPLPPSSLFPSLPPSISPALPFLLTFNHLPIHTHLEQGS